MGRLYANEFVYRLPDYLDDLRGPATGVIQLPDSLYWGPESKIDLSNRSDVQKMYQAVIRIGTEQVQSEWLNRDVLTDNWSNLVLPPRCASAWEARFPELAAQ